MDIVKRLRRNVSRNVYSYLVIFILVFVLVNALSNFSFNLFSCLVMFTVIMMFMGQVLLFTPFSKAYFFYMFSYFSAITISMLYWIARHFPYDGISVVIYVVSITLLIVVPLVVHWLTRKRIGTIPMVPMFSVFFFGLLIILGISQTIASNTYDMLFIVTTVLFTITTILGLNIAYRTRVLDRELGIGDKSNYLGKTKDDLLEKFTNEDAHADIDLLIYYLSSSLESFIDGDFVRSFVDAFKIIDSKGTAFKAIYTLPIAEDRWIHLRDIRNNLSHARIKTEGQKAEKEIERKKHLQKLKELEKRLFRDTLDLLRIVRYEFIDVALKKE